MFPFLGRLPLSYFKAQSDIKDILTRNSWNYVNDNKNLVSSDPTFIALLREPSLPPSLLMTVMNWRFHSSTTSEEPESQW